MTQLILVVLSLALLHSCAGPTSPFGSDSFIAQSNLFEKYGNDSVSRKIASVSNVRVESYPTNKIYHRPFSLKLKVVSKNGPIDKLKYDIIYNNQKLDRWWQTETINYSDDKQLAYVEFKNIYLSPSLRNKIEFHFYLNQSTLPYVYDFSSPQCKLSFNEDINNIPTFEGKKNYISSINKISKEYGLNSYLLAGLVAQESSFDPKAVSWAKAIGLTQVTPLANLDIMREKPDWNFDERISQMSYPVIKYKIFQGDITAKDDWRLDHDKSLEGGSVYMNQLQSYWDSPSSQRLLTSTFQNIPITDIILASYNSGPSRVKSNIKTLKTDWLWSDQLSEARKYVKNIKSYCQHFQEPR